MAASLEESATPATATNTTDTGVTETVEEVVTAPPPAPVMEPKDMKSKEEKSEETKVDNGTVVAENSLNFKEESYFVSDLKESEKKALQDLKLRVEEAIKNNEFKEPLSKDPETKVPSTKEAVATESKDDEFKDAEAKETETKAEGYTITSEVKEEEVMGTVKELRIVETTTETDIKVGEGEVITEETVVTVTETIEVPSHGDVPKHEETTTVSETSNESITVVSEPSTEPPAGEGEIPVEVTVTKVTMEVELKPVEEVYLWGVPLLHTLGDERTDVILLKFLRATDFKVNEAFTMLKDTIP